MRLSVIKYITRSAMLIIGIAESSCQNTTTTSLGIVNDNVVAFLGDLSVSDQDGGMNAMSYTVFIDGLVSVAEVIDEQITVFPNPTSARLTILSEAPIKQYQIINSYGQAVQKGSAKSQINVQHLAKGQYILRLDNATTLLFQKQ